MTKKGETREITWPTGRKPITEYVDLLNEDTLEKIIELRSGGVPQTKLADYLGISYSTLRRYMDYEGFEAFKDAINHRGKEGLIENLQGSLYRAALGYEYDKEIIEIRDENGIKKKTIKKITEHIPANVLANKFALSNLDPARWKERRHNELTGEGGGPIEITTSPRDKIKAKLGKITAAATTINGAEQE